MLEATARVLMESNMPSGWHLSSSSCRRAQQLLQAHRYLTLCRQAGLSTATGKQSACAVGKTRGCIPVRRAHGGFP